MRPPSRNGRRHGGPPLAAKPGTRMRRIELVLMLRLVFRLTLRQAEGFEVGTLRLLGQTLRVPDHTTLSRRSCSFAGRQL